MSFSPEIFDQLRKVHLKLLFYFTNSFFLLKDNSFPIYTICKYTVVYKVSLYETLL